MPIAKPGQPALLLLDSALDSHAPPQLHALLEPVVAPPYASPIYAQIALLELEAQLTVQMVLSAPLAAPTRLRQHIQLDHAMQLNAPQATLTVLALPKLAMPALVSVLIFHARSQQR